MTPLMTPAFLTHGTPPMHEGRPGEGPAVAPRRYRWTLDSRRQSAALPFAFACEWGCARGIPPPESLPLDPI